MAVYSYELDNSFSFPNILVYKRLKDGIHTSWRINSAEGYVFYDSTANFTEPDENGVEQPVKYYYSVAYLPGSFNFNNFPWVAVPRDSVDENYIFGVGDNDHEVM